MILQIEYKKDMRKCRREKLIVNLIENNRTKCNRRLMFKSLSRVSVSIRERSESLFSSQ